MIIECHSCKARVDGEILAFHEEDEAFWKTRTHLLKCPACKSALVGVAETTFASGSGEEVWTELVRVHPKPRRILSSSVPKLVKESLKESEKCMQVGAYIAATAMAGRSLEAVCRHFATEATNLGRGLKDLHDKKVIDDRLFQWGEQLRIHRNVAAHATDIQISATDAEDIVTFVYAIVEYVFELTQKFDDFQKRRKKDDKTA